MATKIIKSKVKNIKSISEFEIELNGNTAYIIGGNTKGKTTFIRFLFDRLSLNKTNDNSILKDKKQDGISEIIMSDGCSFKYIITSEGKEKLIYRSNGIEVRATKEIIGKYIGKPFDIDKFLELQPKEKYEYITKIFNIDVSEEKKMLLEYQNEKKIWNNMISEKEILLKNIDYIDEEPIDIDSLYKQREFILNKYNKEKEDIDNKNKKNREDYDKKYNELLSKMLAYNKQQQENAEKKNRLLMAYEMISLYDDFKDIANNLYEQINKIEIKPEKTVDGLKQYLGEFVNLAYPEYPNLTEIDEKINNAKEHNSKLKAKDEYINLQNEIKSLKLKVEDINSKIVNINNSIKEKIASITLPDGITIDGENIYYKGLILSRETLATSQLYIVAMLLGSMILKDLKVMHFDCSALDKESMKFVLDFAKKNDLQLLIERPDFEAGDLRFELIED